MVTVAHTPRWARSTLGSFVYFARNFRNALLYVFELKEYNVNKYTKTTNIMLYTIFMRVIGTRRAEKAPNGIE